MAVAVVVVVAVAVALAEVVAISNSDIVLQYVRRAVCYCVEKKQSKHKQEKQHTTTKAALILFGVHHQAADSWVFLMYVQLQTFLYAVQP